MRRIDVAFPKELRKSTNETEMRIEFVNGSSWQMIGSDRYDTVVGAGPVGIVFSEWALANPTAWGIFQPMLEETDGWALWITTPRGRNHAYTMYNAAMGNPAWYAATQSIDDTGALSPERRDAALQDYFATLGEDVGTAKFSQEYLCDFNAAILGSYFGREISAVRSEGRIKDIDPDPGLPVHVAWDLGVSDSTVLWFFQIVGKRLRVLDCYANHGREIKHYADYILEKKWKKGSDYVPHDAKVKEFGSGKTRVETMIACGLKPKLVPNIARQDGINALRQTLPLCTFHPRCETGIGALEQYQREWSDEKKCFSDTPLHNWCSDYADSARYMAVAWQALQPPKEDSDPLAGIDPAFILDPPNPHENHSIRI